MPLLEPVPDVQSLDLLRSVAELGSIRQSAFRHSISQPAASMRLRTLERTLGLELLDRSHGRARLTAAGTAVVQWSEVVLEAMRELQLGAQALRVGQSSQLRIAASMTVAEYLIPSWLHRLRTAEPSISVSLQMGNSLQVEEMVHRGDASIGFVEGDRPPRSMSSRIVQSDNLVVVVAANHEWARRKKPLSARELSATPLVLRELGSGTREVLEAAMRARNLDVTPLIELGSTTALKAAVSSGEGAGVLSSLTIESEVRDGQLIVVACSDVPLARSIRVVWSKGRALSSSAKLLMRHVDADVAQRRVAQRSASK
jgi:DNA-binding transcriptional LysR family regulator